MSTIEQPTYFLQTYGCQMNTADSERLSGLLEALGLSETKHWEDASTVILYSCSVRQIAEDKVYGWGKKVKEFNEAREQRNKGSTKQESKGAIKQEGITNHRDTSFANDSVRAGVPAREAGGGEDRHLPLFILTGCMAGSVRGERKRFSEDELRRKLPFIKYFLAPSEWEQQLPLILAREELVVSERLGVSGFEARRTTGDTAFVKISEGCDNFCSYCVVPYGRGREVSRPRTEILDEVRHLADLGFHHITLLGQNVNSWGIADAREKHAIRINSDTPLPFASLLRDIHEIDGVQKIGFLTANPFDFTRDLVTALALPKLDRYLHMAIQSGSDTVLGRMNRRHTIAEYLRLISDIRKSVPEIELGTDIIVGFPGETEEEFTSTLDLLQTVRYNVVFSAMYSPRPGTSAATKYADDVPKTVKKARYRRVQELLAQLCA